MTNAEFKKLAPTPPADLRKFLHLKATEPTQIPKSFLWDTCEKHGMTIQYVVP
jgi:hypothetical protein